MYFYVFVRQDICTAQQIIQTNHATLEMSALTEPQKEMPNLVLIGVPGILELKAVVKHLELNEIPHSSFVDTDFDFGLAAVTTIPLDQDDGKRKVLLSYPLWKE